MIQPLSETGPVVRNNRFLLLCVLIAIITAIVFFPSLQNGFTNWDDDAYVTRNPDIQGFTVRNVGKVFSTTYAGNYQPLTMLVYMADYSIGGLDPMVFHATGLVIHIVNALLVFALLYGLSGSSVAGAAAALIFAVHPLKVESVAWVSEQKDVLAALFFFLSLIAYRVYLKRGGRRFYGLCLLSLAFSLLSKPMAVSQPFILVLIDYLHGKKPDSRSFAQKAPFFIVAAVFAVITLFTQHSSGAINTYGSLPVIQKICVPFYGIIFYMGKILLPVKLAALYTMPPQSDVLMNTVLLTAPLIVAGAAAVLFFLHSNSKQVMFGSLFFLITLLPVLQIVPVGPAIVADRYTYIPMIGICFLIAWMVARIVNGRLGSNAARKVVYAVVVVLIFASGILTFQRCKVWNNDMTLWNDSIEKYPGSLAYNNRGAAYGDRGKMDQAIADFNSAIEQDPKFAKPYNNRGLANMTLGNANGALADFSMAIALDGKNYDAFNNRGILYVYSNELDKAVADFSTALVIKADYARAYTNRGIAYQKKGFQDLAVRDFEKAIALNPDDITAVEKRKQAIAARLQTKQK